MDLTPKQWRIIKLVAEGLRNKEIAKLVGNSEGGIKNQLRVIFNETGMSTRLELAMWYVKGGCDEESSTIPVVKPVSFGSVSQYLDLRHRSHPG